MSKYIIDTGDYLFTTDGVLVVGFDCDNKPATFYNSLDNLEELNSDYINEHYGELQDEAYQQGLNDAWEAAKKLFSSMADSDIEKAFPIEWNNGGFKALMNLQPQEAIAKLKAYESKQKDRIEVGDEVQRDGHKFIVTKIIDDTWFDGIDANGTTTIAMIIANVTKTGKHYDIASILEAMRE